MNVYPVILSGGSGTRLWPLSREAMPKQFLPLLAGRSPFQETLGRIAGAEHVRAPVVVANQEHRFLVAEQMRSMQVEPHALLLETAGRNTAPAAAIAALRLQRDDPDALMLVLPADHHVPDAPAF